jgi:aspartyl-tRNA synthetase
MAEEDKIQVDPLGDWVRTHDCGSLRVGDAGQEAVLMGWVNTRRDLGNLIFVDLRDRGGTTQVVFDPQVSPESHERAQILRNEWVIAVRGEVSRRLEGQENPSMSTGEIELRAAEIRILNRTRVPPFQVDGAVDASEPLRLQYRYLEMRRPQVFSILQKRHRIASCIRAFLNDQGFVDVETPFLTKSTPEGARDYLVPSRVSRGLFYALPQSPQLFKQLLMIAGFDRYYQIVKCFRDEDLRADRQPEFTQVDLEMAFVNEEGVMAVFEGLMKTVFREILDHEVPLPMARLEFSEAMERFGTDRPDMRFGMELKDLSEIAGQSDFRVFQGVVQGGGRVKGMTVPGAADAYSRKSLDALADAVKPYGAKGLVWIRVTDGGWQSSVSKFFKDEQQKALNEKAGADPGDLILMIADKPQTANEAMGALRLRVADDMDLIPQESYAFVWITRFPLLEYDEEAGRLVAVHHPFTSPLEEDVSLMDTTPEKVRARSYDLVLNGSELGGGSIRIHDLSLQQKVFHALGISPEEARTKFGFLLEALKYGAPPHGGMALGFDRLVAIMTGTKSIREVIAFPKTTRAACLLTDAPSPVSEAQLRELGLKSLSD